jgi:hypothetical protein
VAKFIVKATDQGWEIHKDEVLLGTYASPTRGIGGAGKLRAKLKANGERCLIKFEARAGHPRSN